VHDGLAVGFGKAFGELTGDLDGARGVESAVALGDWQRSPASGL
jgi:hypothetical protein